VKKLITKSMMESIPFQYAESVLKGDIVTGQNVKMAVNRFYDMIETDNDYTLDNNDGQKVINFFPTFLKHTKGPDAGSPFHLSPYQQFTYYNVFAWKKLDDRGRLVRLIRTVYEKVARKNGKTAGLAGLGLYTQGCDGEQGPEIYVGATKELQAKVLWEQAHHFVFKGHDLRKAGYKNTQREIRTNFNTGVFRFLGGDSNTQDGLNPSLSIIDEYHAHKTDGVREVLESAMGARLNPLTYVITTAGTNVASVCKAYEDTCVEILEGIKKDDSTFIMMHDLDECDDWENPENWEKANPNIGRSVSLDYLHSEFIKAQNQPSKAPNFKTKHLNKWVDAPEVWIPTEIWMNNKVSMIPISAFEKYGSYSGLDLSTTTDITAYVILSEPDESGFRYLKAFFFCPKDTIDLRSKEDRVPYRAWADAGHLIATPGNTVDYHWVESVIKDTYMDHGVKRVEIDKWNASQTANNLEELGIEVSYFSQSISNISFPTKQFEKLVYEGKILHDGNPILVWMLSGCVIYRDPNENIKVHKGKSHSGNKRVDGIVASIMALGGSLSIEENKDSKYNNMVVEDLTEKK
jgi:phage terminase large subunit-like protein